MRLQPPVSDRATGTVGRAYRQREAEVEEDDGEETETGGRRKSVTVTKKPRRGVAVPPLAMNLRSHGKGRR